MSSAEKGVVAAGHPLTAQAGARVLQEGGNAVDATVAAMLTSFVAEALLTGLGAGGYMMVAGAGVEPTLLDFFAQAPTRLGDGSEADLYALEVNFGDAEQVFHIGPASCAVYGTPAGASEAIRRWGSMALEELAAPAARMAHDGVPINAVQAYIAELLHELLTSTPECAALWAPAGRILEEGEIFRDRELGEALTRLGVDGAEPFYRGDIATAVCAWLTERGGSLTPGDLAGYGPVAREPVRIAYRDRTILTNPPPAAGGALLAYALGLLDQSPGPPGVAPIVEAMRSAQSERTAEFLEGLAEDGFVDRFMGSRLGSTTHIAVIDGDGLACSATSTNGECSGVVVPGTGIHLNNMMGEEDLNPMGFHLHPAGRRLPSMMAPTVVMHEGEVELVLGSAGSNRIRSALLQTILGVVDHGLSVSEAIGAPRVHFESGVVFAEPGIDLSVLAPDTRTVQFSERNLFFGGVQAALRRGGTLSGAGDPRRGGAAVKA
jgi:gamma-glutamyltranspeptidase / glutathione hydrolase